MIALATLSMAVLLLAQTAGTGPTLTSPVGNGEPGYTGDGGPASDARLNGPFDVAYDADGNLYLSDTFNHAIRRVSPNP